MIISPPFLPALTVITPPTATTPAETEAEQEWLARAMTQPRSRAPGTRTVEGSYPVSAAFQWHNGLHLVAPHEPSGALPVCAIADGKVIFVNRPTPYDADPMHPQNYMPDATPAWTDNGCVILQHTTDIGAAGDTSTQFVYYSLYMHLGTVEATIRVDRPIYRKDPIGAAGQFHGAERQLHFEICCDKSNLDRLIGREALWTETEPPVTPTSDGRADTVFGEVFIYLPASTPVSAAPPTNHIRASSNAHITGNTLRAAQWIGIRLDKGSAVLRSIDVQGRPIGAASGRTDKDFEYALYTEACKRHTNYLQRNPIASGPTAQIISSPSGWYELLRFGRNLGPDPLPSDAAHWREIPTASGSIWADLNAIGSKKFSEADFLAITGWNFFDDDETPLDLRCDSVELKRLIRDPDPTNAKRMETGHLGQRLGEPDVQLRLRRVICNFPSEWDATNIELFIGWVREPKHGYGLEQEHNWTRFFKYCRAVTFGDLPSDYLKATWRFHPSEFVSVMRRCGWLSREELARIYRRAPAIVLKQYQISLNKVTRKHDYSASMVRLSHFLGQGAIESSYLKAMQETSMKGSVVGINFYGKTINEKSQVDESILGHWYGSAPNEKDLWYGSTKYNSNGILIASSYNWRGGNLGDPDAQKFRGRGFKQITGLLNYSKYWVYRGWLASGTFTDNWWDDEFYKKHMAADMKKIPPKIDDPHRATANAYNCIDTGGWYLGSERPKTLAKIDQDHFGVAKNPADIEAEKILSWEVTRAINGGGIDKEKRLFETIAAKNILL